MYFEQMAETLCQPIMTVSIPMSKMICCCSADFKRHHTLSTDVALSDAIWQVVPQFHVLARNDMLSVTVCTKVGTVAGIQVCGTEGCGSGIALCLF